MGLHHLPWSNFDFRGIMGGRHWHRPTYWRLKWPWNVCLIEKKLRGSAVHMGWGPPPQVSPPWPLDSTTTIRGRHLDNPFEQDQDLEDIPLDTGQPDFDEVTLFLRDEAAMQDFLDSAGPKYDQQFI
jgi:hypothetical protein